MTYYYTVYSSSKDVWNQRTKEGVCSREAEQKPKASKSGLGAGEEDCRTQGSNLYFRLAQQLCETLSQNLKYYYYYY